MANERIIERLITDCEVYRAGQSTKDQLFNALLGHANALEGLSDETYRELRTIFQNLGEIDHAKHSEKVAFDLICEQLQRLIAALDRI